MPPAAQNLCCADLNVGVVSTGTKCDAEEKNKIFAQGETATCHCMFAFVLVWLSVSEVVRRSKVVAKSNATVKEDLTKQDGQEEGANKGWSAARGPTSWGVPHWKKHCVSLCIHCGDGQSFLVQRKGSSCNDILFESNIGVNVYMDSMIKHSGYPLAKTCSGLQIRGSKFHRLDSNSRELEFSNCLGLVLGCIEAKFCK